MDQVLEFLEQIKELNVAPLLLSFTNLINVSVKRSKRALGLYHT